MGNTNFTAGSFDVKEIKGIQSSHLNLNLAVSKENFVYHHCIGKGGFGKVWKVDRKRKAQPFAMKEMSKARIITKRSVKSVINER
jgi:cell division protein FtsB